MFSNKDYEMSEQLFLDVWKEYGEPDEVFDAIITYNILNDIVTKSKGLIVLDHYSQINFDEIIKVEYSEENKIFKLYWLDNNHYRMKHLNNELSEFDELCWSVSGCCTYEYLAVDIDKIKFIKADTHIFILVQSNVVSERELKKRIVGNNELIDVTHNTNDLYTRYTFWEGDKENLVKVECIANGLPYYVCVIQPKERIPHTGISKDLMLVSTFYEINKRLDKVGMLLNSNISDKDELFSIGNTIRRILEYALKHFCVYLDIPMEIEQKYGYIELGDLRKKLKVTSHIQISQSMINMANELSHDSGKYYNAEEIKEFYFDIVKILQDIQRFISNKEKL